jgi:hypothetical protein
MALLVTATLTWLESLRAFGYTQTDQVARQTKSARFHDSSYLEGIEATGQDAVREKRRSCVHSVEIKVKQSQYGP